MIAGNGGVWQNAALGGALLAMIEGFGWGVNKFMMRQQEKAALAQQKEAMNAVILPLNMIWLPLPSMVQSPH
jgi:hypothetical protein